MKRLWAILLVAWALVMPSPARANENNCTDGWSVDLYNADATWCLGDTVWHEDDDADTYTSGNYCCCDKVIVFGEWTGSCDDEEPGGGDWRTSESTHEDCDDSDPYQWYTGAVEACDDHDNNCDGNTDEGAKTTYYADVDGDGYGNTFQTTEACSSPGPGYVELSGDCDDTEASVNPGEAEACDGVDTDCSGALSASEVDTDGDHYVACVEVYTGFLLGSLEGGDDCVDTDATIYPGAAALQANLCTADVDEDGWGDLYLSDAAADDGADCDDTDPDIYAGSVLREDDTFCGADADGDGYGDADSPNPNHDHGTDCNDRDADVYPGLALHEADDFCGADADGDGYGDEFPSNSSYGVGTDCDDGDDTIYPGALIHETPTSFCGADADGDGYGSASPAPGHDTGTDCDDTSARIYPGSATRETLPDYCGADSDSDGWGDMSNSAGLQAGSDCDDSDSRVYPGSVRYEARDFCGIDSDSDGYASSNPTNTDMTAGSDCDDTDAAVYPGHAINEDALDFCGADVDGDGYGDATPSSAFYDLGVDCDDRDEDTYPGSALYEGDLCVDDQDRDGYGDSSPSTGFTAGQDCDDTDDGIYPGSVLTEDESFCGVDADLDGFADNSPPTGLDAGDDCDDRDDGIYPGSVRLEVIEGFCGIDSDLDGYGTANPPAGYDAGTDCDDSDPDAYAGSVAFEPAGFCGADLDADGYGDASPGPGLDAGADCNDGDDTVYPGSTRFEPPDLCGKDADLDGYADADLYDGGQDCDDQDGDVKPGAAEGCNGIDNDCDTTLSTYETDDDGDGYVDCAFDSANWYGSGAVIAGSDCDDANVLAYPAAPEYCDTVDTDCDGVPATAAATEDVDVLDPTTFYADTDGDGYGNRLSTQAQCVLPSGYAANDDDCNDTDDTILPGATEVCDGVLNDCNGATTPADEIDGDNDGYVACGYTGSGDWKGTTEVNVGDDCGPDDPTAYPFASELCDGLTNNCNSRTDPSNPVSGLPAAEDDSDGDRYVECYDGTSTWPDSSTRPPVGLDCADDDATVYPAAGELCDGQVNDCDHVSDGLPEDEQDPDADGFVECGYFGGDWYDGSSPVEGTDCEPLDGTTYPGAPEQCDGAYNDCDARIANPAGAAPDEEQDLDGDDYVACGYDPSTAPWQGGVAPSEGTDCGPYDATAYPGAFELCDGQFNDCDDVSYVAGGAPDIETDDDGDAFVECELLPTVDWVGDATVLADGGGLDCDDENPAAFPGSAPFDDADACLLDEDDDDYGDSSAADPYEPGTDCDDASDLVHPFATELCELEDELDEHGEVVVADQVDNDCDGGVNTEDGFPVTDGPTTLYQDRDVDGYGNISGITFDVCVLGEGFSVSANDCDDTDDTIHPGAEEICNEIDEDCDLIVDEPEDLGEESGCLDLYRDADSDQFGDVAQSMCLCLSGSDEVAEYLGYTYVRDQSDCYDYDPNIFPGNGVEHTVIDPEDGNPTLKTTETEWIDGHDNDCDRNIPVIELDCDDDGSLALVAPDAPTVVQSAEELGLAPCRSGTTREISCLGEETLTATCDTFTGLYVVRYDVSADGFGGRFQGGHREYPEGRVCTTAGDCDDQCASRCPDQEEVCDGVDDNCSDVIPQDAVRNIPVSILNDRQREDAGVTALAGTVVADELDVDQDGYIGCDSLVDLGDTEVHYTTRTCADVLEAPADPDCENLCGWQFPEAEERCNGFTDTCGGPVEGTDGDRDHYATCGAGGPDDGSLQDDLFVVVWVPDAEESDTGVAEERTFIPLILPRLEAPECDEDLERTLLALVDDAAALDDAILRGDDTILLDLCQEAEGGQCAIVRLVLGEDADAQLHTPGEGEDDEGFGDGGYVGAALESGWMTEDCASHPEQLISRTVWNRPRIVTARHTVIEWECRRLFGVACADVDETTPLLGSWSTPAPDPGESLETNDRWWKEIGRYSPQSQTTGAMMTCWGDPTDELEPTGQQTGGDCEDGTNVANRDAAEGPGDLVGVYWDAVPECDRCVDGLDNNCDGTTDCEDPSCAACFVGQGGGCGASDSPCSATGGCTSTTPAPFGPAQFALLLFAMTTSSVVRRRKRA